MILLSISLEHPDRTRAQSHFTTGWKKTTPSVSRMDGLWPLRLKSSPAPAHDLLEIPSAPTLPQIHRCGASLRFSIHRKRDRKDRNGMASSLGNGSATAEYPPPSKSSQRCIVNELDPANCLCLQRDPPLLMIATPHGSLRTPRPSNLPSGNDPNALLSRHPRLPTSTLLREEVEILQPAGSCCWTGGSLDSNTVRGDIRFCAGIRRSPLIRSTQFRARLAIGVLYPILLSRLKIEFFRLGVLRGRAPPWVAAQGSTRLEKSQVSPHGLNGSFNLLPFI